MKKIDKVLLKGLSYIMLFFGLVALFNVDSSVSNTKLITAIGITFPIVAAFLYRVSVKLQVYGEPIEYKELD